jgi:hypothetical protein
MTQNLGKAIGESAAEFNFSDWYFGTNKKETKEETARKQRNQAARAKYIPGANLSAPSIPAASTPPQFDYAALDAKQAEFRRMQDAVVADEQATRGKTLSPERQAESRELVRAMLQVRDELINLKTIARAQEKHAASTAHSVR